MDKNKKKKILGFDTTLFKKKRKLLNIAMHKLGKNLKSPFISIVTAPNAFG